MKAIICLMTFACQSILLIAQNKDGGINWIQDLTWEQIQKKAKFENKFIFLDCYATWCRPCKLMDEFIFSKSSVGEIINQKFIPVKIQFDKTKSDNDFIKSWYNTATVMQKKYKVTALPTYLFFTPQGKIIHKERGYKKTNEFLQIAELAVQPGKKYIDPYSEFDGFVENYYKGKINYALIPRMIKQAKELGEKELIARLTNDYINFLQKQEKQSWYKKDNIEFLASNLKSIKSPFFEMFYSESDRIDKTIGKNEYSRKAIDRLIKKEIIDSFLKKFYKGKTGKMLIKHEFEPNWDSLFKVIKEQVGEKFADRGLRRAKYEYYAFVGPVSDKIKYFIQIVEARDINKSDPDFDLNINGRSWDIFTSSLDSKEIHIAIGWMEELLNRDNDYRNSLFAPMDTYGNLLFKANCLFGDDIYEKAIEWQRKAVNEAIRREADSFAKSYQENLDKMLLKKPTWSTK